MFDISFGELLICAIVALLVLGPERLPGAARTVGRWVGRARHTVNHFTDQIDREIRAEQLKRRIEEEVRKSGVDSIAREVNEALRAPLSLPADKPPAVPENSIAPPAAATAAESPAAVADSGTPVATTPATPAATASPTPPDRA
ncbi:MAG: Sec-independent protein translocase protein TatB [Gammaproteobacteria bacterium]